MRNENKEHEIFACFDLARNFSKTVSTVRCCSLAVNSRPEVQRLAIFFKNRDSDLTVYHFCFSSMTFIILAKCFSQKYLAANSRDNLRKIILAGIVLAEHVFKTVEYFSK